AAAAGGGDARRPGGVDGAPDEGEPATGPVGTDGVAAPGHGPAGRTGGHGAAPAAAGRRHPGRPPRQPGVGAGRPGRDRHHAATPVLLHARTAAVVRTPEAPTLSRGSPGTSGAQKSHGTCKTPSTPEANPRPRTTLP